MLMHLMQTIYLLDMFSYSWLLYMIEFNTYMPLTYIYNSIIKNKLSRERKNSWSIIISLINELAIILIRIFNIQELWYWRGQLTTDICWQYNRGTPCKSFYKFLGYSPPNYICSCQHALGPLIIDMK